MEVWILRGEHKAIRAICATREIAEQINENKNYTMSRFDVITSKEGLKEEEKKYPWPFDWIMPALEDHFKELGRSTGYTHGFLSGMNNHMAKAWDLQKDRLEAINNNILIMDKDIQEIKKALIRAGFIQES